MCGGVGDYWYFVVLIFLGMSLKRKQLVMIGRKEAMTKESHRRDPLTNYCEGYFFVTMNVREGGPRLCRVVGSVEARDGEADAPRCVYTDLGARIRECWMNIGSFYALAEGVECEVMPEHFHGLVLLKRGNKTHLGKVIAGFMAGCTHAYWDELGVVWQKGVKGDVLRDRDHTMSYKGPSLFERGYNDVEAVDEGEVEVKICYLREQARRRLMKEGMADRFRIYRGLALEGWKVEGVKRVLDRCDKMEGEGALRGMRFEEGGLVVDFVGDRGLIVGRRLLPLVCHRRDRGDYDKQRGAVMAAAREGAVIVSAFISEWERGILTELMCERLPVVRIVANGLNDRYKPSGLNFYAVAEKRMGVVSPWVYRFERRGSVSRERCLIMNELARVIAGRGDEWWK